MKEKNQKTEKGKRGFWGGGERDLLPTCLQLQTAAKIYIWAGTEKRQLRRGGVNTTENYYTKKI